jgi:hypothetical protein
MAASLFGTSSTPNVSVSGSIVPQSFVANAGQTLFSLSQFTYTPATGSLMIFVNGVLQKVTTDYLETSSSSFTTVEAMIGGEVVTAIGIPVVQVSTVPLGATGSATFAAGTSVAVAFSSVQPDANYKVLLGPQANKNFWVTNKTVSSFTINASATSSDTVDWAIGR